MLNADIISHCHHVITLHSPQKYFTNIMSIYKESKTELVTVLSQVFKDKILVVLMI
jgi:hypothetical protein